LSRDENSKKSSITTSRKLNEKEFLEETKGQELASESQDEDYEGGEDSDEEKVNCSTNV
jgi:hypothetical protein